MQDNPHFRERHRTARLQKCLRHVPWTHTRHILDGFSSIIVTSWRHHGIRGCDGAASCPIRRTPTHTCACTGSDANRNSHGENREVDRRARQGFDQVGSRSDVDTAEGNSVATIRTVPVCALPERASENRKWRDRRRARLRSARPRRQLVQSAHAFVSGPDRASRSPEAQRIHPP